MDPIFSVWQLYYVVRYRLKFCNKFFSDIFEYPEDEINKKSLTDIIDQRYIDLFTNHLKYNFDKTIDLQLISKNNKKKYIRFSFDKYSHE